MGARQNFLGQIPFRRPVTSAASRQHCVFATVSNMTLTLVTCDRLACCPLNLSAFGSITGYFSSLSLFFLVFFYLAGKLLPGALLINGATATLRLRVPIISLQMRCQVALRNKDMIPV